MEPIEVNVRRGGVVEATHVVHAVAVRDGAVVEQAGDLLIPYLHTSQVPYSEMVALVASLNGGRKRAFITDPFYSLPAKPLRMGNGWMFHETAATVRTPEQQEGSERGFTVRSFVTEMNGVGAMPSEELARRLGRQRVVGVHSSQRSKEDAFSRGREFLDVATDARGQRACARPKGDTE